MAKLMDSLKQESQEKQTGKVNYCEIHKEEFGFGSRGFNRVCISCDKIAEKEESRIANISKCHSILDLPARLKECSFDNYKTNSKKAEIIKGLCIEFSVTYEKSGGLIMLGGVGTGKTHLGAAICKAACDNGHRAMLVTVPIIIRAVRATWNKNHTGDSGERETEQDVIRKYASDYKILVIDEIGSQYGTDSEKIIISEIINDRYNNMLPTVIIGNVTLSEAEEYLGARVIDRIKDNGSLLVFDWESYRKMKK